MKIAVSRDAHNSTNGVARIRVLVLDLQLVTAPEL